MSCDKCKSRKTKCNNPIPGPCDYCRNIGVVCQIDAGKRKQRPYYFVSEEEFQHMRKILQHCYPNRELDLPDLRHMVDQLSNNSTDDKGIRESFPNHVSPTKSEHRQSLEVSAALPTDTQNPDGVVLEEIGQLHKELGCLLRDSNGTLRYMGAQSGVSFNAAVRSLRTDSMADKPDKDIIPPMTTTSLPPATPETPAGAVPHYDIYLPPKELCM